MKLLDYFFAARPLLHLPIWSIYLVSWYLLHRYQSESFTVGHLLMPGCISLAAAGAYYLNQVYDFQSDLHNRKLGFLQQELLTRRSLITAYLITSFLALGLAMLVSTVAVLLISAFVVLGLGYSAPPFRFKDRPLAGLMANALSFGGMVSLAADPGTPFASVSGAGIQVALYFTLAVAAIYLLTTLPDRDGDAVTGKHTLAVKFSPTVVRLLALGLMVLSGATAWHLWTVELMALSGIGVAVVLISICLASNACDLFAGKLPIVLLTLLAGYFYPWYFLFVVALISISRSYYRRRFNMIYPRLT